MSLFKLKKKRDKFYTLLLYTNCQVYKNRYKHWCSDVHMDTCKPIATSTETYVSVSQQQEVTLKQHIPHENQFY